MVALTCRIAALNEGLDTTLFQTQDFADFLAGHYRSGSGREIDLRVEWHDLSPILPAKTPAIDGDLHFQLLRLTQNRSQPPIDTIGLLVASSYDGDDGMFGLMFDRGVPTSTHDLYTAVPREGAAVFIDTIAGRRVDHECESEYGFTAVHELGHVFNLTHAARDPPTFMSQSARSPSAYPSSAYFFDIDDQDWLGKCSQDLRVMPGGSPFIGLQGNNRSGRQELSDDDLLLHIELRPDTCTRYEPIHLDVMISLKKNRSRGARIPRMVDPTHCTFNIYITEPRGRVRKYRSSTHCCPTGRTISVTRARPFRRDIVIVGEQTGMTFREAGIYTIQVEYLIGTERLLRSNSAELRILPDARRRDRFLATVEALKSPGAQSLLRFRRSRSPKVRKELAEVIDSWKGPWDERKSLIGYRYARMVLDSPRIASGTARDRALHYLDKTRLLGGHREARIHEVVSSIEKTSRGLPRP